MEGNNRDQLVKVSVVSGVRNVEAVVWRRRQSVMSEQDVDDVAFLTGIFSHTRSVLFSQIVVAFEFYFCVLLESTAPQAFSEFPSTMFIFLCR